jgi:two-component system OmpR family response regulator
MRINAPSRTGSFTAFSWGDQSSNDAPVVASGRPSFERSLNSAQARSGSCAGLFDTDISGEPDGTRESYQGVWGPAILSGDDRNQSCSQNQSQGTCVNNMSAAGRILIADKNPSLRQAMAAYFARHNVPTSSASNRSELNRHLLQGYVRFVVLDLQLDRGDGRGLLRSIRARSEVPVIVVASTEPNQIDRTVRYLELGADDFVVKPLNLRELVARVRAVLRRQEFGRRKRATDSNSGGYRFDGWQLSCRTRRLVDPNGAPVSLSNSDYTLLLAFLNAPQHPLSREQLQRATRMHDDIFDRSIDVRVLRLRRKLKNGFSTPCMIRTERGVGYAFTASVDSY